MKNISGWKSDSLKVRFKQEFLWTGEKLPSVLIRFRIVIFYLYFYITIYPPLCCHRLFTTSSLLRRQSSAVVRQLHSSIIAWSVRLLFSNQELLAVERVYSSFLLHLHWSDSGLWSSIYYIPIASWYSPPSSESSCSSPRKTGRSISQNLSLLGPLSVSWIPSTVR